MGTKTKWVAPVDPDGRLIVDAYLRMSDGFDGKEENREDQLADVMPLYERNGWALGEVIVDEVSAWKRDVKRKGWERLLVRIETGESAGVSFYHQDRLMRQPWDLERLFKLVEDGRERIVVASAHGKLDLLDPTQRFLMRNIVGHACLSSDDTSRRAKRKNQGRRARGLLTAGGPRPFAWPGVHVTPERLELERDALKWAFEAVDKGTTLTQVARNWNEREVFSYYDKPWEPTTVRNTMRRQRYAGRIEHDGAVVGTMVDHEPLIDPDLFDRVIALFASRKRGRPISPKALGTGILHCHCGAKLYARPRYRFPGGVKESVPTYFCNKTQGGCGRCVIDQEPIDAVLRGYVIAELSKPGAAERTSKYLATSRDRRAELEAKIKAADEAMADVMEKLARGQLREAAVDRYNQTLMKTLKADEAELNAINEALSSTVTVKEMTGLEVEAEWDEAWASGDKQPCREMLRAVAETVQLVIKPGGRGGSIAAKERLNVRLLDCGTDTPTLSPRV